MLIVSSWQRGFPFCPGTTSSLASRSMNLVFFHSGPLARAGSHSSSVLGRFEDPKQVGSLICTGISQPHPSLLATGKVAAVNKCRGPRSTSGLPLMGSKVKCLPPCGLGENVGFVGVDTRTMQSFIARFKYDRVSLRLVRA